MKIEGQTGRSGAHARAFLQDWRGHLVVDDCAGSERSGRSVAAIQSLLATAKPNDLEPAACNTELRIDEC